MAGNGDYDIFGPQWGLGLPIGWFDTTSISALLDAPLAGGAKIDQLVLGWDGESVDCWEACRMMLRAKGFFPGYSAEGKLTFARARLASVLDIGNTTVAPLPRTLREESAEGDGIDRLVAIVGKTPWFDGDRIEVNLRSDADVLDPPNSLRNGIFASKNAVELDLSVLAPADLESAAYQLQAYVAMRGLALTRIYVRANDPGTIDLGDIVKLGDPNLQTSWFTDIDGNRVEIDASARWYGQVLGFKRNLMDGTIDLELRMNTDEFARVRAPAAVVASDASNVYTCTNTFGGPLGGGTDTEQFTAGDEVELWTPDGTRRSGTAASPDVQYVTSTGTNTITLDAAFTTTPTAGDIIRIAHMSDANGFPDSDSDLVDGYCPYVFAADAARTLGPDDVDAHIYGFGGL
jgi:hypothetical protein